MKEDIVIVTRSRIKRHLTAELYSICECVISQVAICFVLACLSLSLLSALSRLCLLIVACKPPECCCQRRDDRRRLVGRCLLTFVCIDIKVESSSTLDAAAAAAAGRRGTGGSRGD